MAIGFIRTVYRVRQLGERVINSNGYITMFFLDAIRTFVRDKRVECVSLFKNVRRCRAREFPPDLQAIRRVI